MLRSSALVSRVLFRRLPIHAYNASSTASARPVQDMPNPPTFGAVPSSGTSTWLQMTAAALGVVTSFSLGLLALNSSQYFSSTYAQLDKIESSTRSQLKEAEIKMESSLDKMESSLGKIESSTRSQLKEAEIKMESSLDKMESSLGKIESSTRSQLKEAEYKMESSLDKMESSLGKMESSTRSQLKDVENKIDSQLDMMNMRACLQDLRAHFLSNSLPDASNGLLFALRSTNLEKLKTEEDVLRMELHLLSMQKARGKDFDAAEEVRAWIDRMGN
ncbi:hypothetical protein I4F81_007570 [Pyropia yezoensis]|nr:hypothetical protein I4F81_007570 [Neopyropia yezoensis]